MGNLQIPSWLLCLSCQHNHPTWSYGLRSPLCSLQFSTAPLLSSWWGDMLTLFSFSLPVPLYWHLCYTLSRVEFEGCFTRSFASVIDNSLSLLFDFFCWVYVFDSSQCTLIFLYSPAALCSRRLVGLDTTSFPWIHKFGPLGGWSYPKSFSN